MKRDKKWLAEKQAMANRFIGLMGFRVPIRDIDDSAKAIAYSTAEPAIYLSNDSYLTNGLNDAKKRAIHLGLFTHELLHIKFTNFKYANEVAKELTPGERRIFMMIFNILEDPAIENMASSFIGGNLLRCLKYTVKRINDLAKPINEYSDPFEQCLNAMIQIGDMYILKGEFTSPLAKKLFYKISSKMLELIEEGSSERRVDLAFEIFEELRPIWEDKVMEFDPEELESFVRTVMGGKGISDGFGSGEDLDAEEMADLCDLSKGAQRHITFKKLEELSEEEKTLYEEEEEEEEEELLEGEEAKNASGIPGSEDELEIVYDDKEIDLSRPSEYDPEEFELDRDAYDFIDRLIQAELEIENVDFTPAEKVEIPEFPEVSKKYTKKEYRCKNAFVTIRNPEVAEAAYTAIVKKNLGRINACYKKLKTIFVEDAEAKEYRSSGKLSLKKTMSTTVSPKVFTKAVDPEDKSNMAVTVLIDESGSMNGSRIERAKEAAINLAEIFGKLGIPLYILGFTADTNGAEAVHHHYTTWENKKADRMKLTSIHAEANNFDGYSIRYASNVLNTRPEAHKVLIVISDGAPACYSYNTGMSGFSDTKDAIRESRSKGQYVLGVAIGADVKVLQEMYGNDFIFITSGDDLFTGIMKKFTAMVKKW